VKQSQVKAIIERARDVLERYPKAAWGPGKAVVHDGQMERAAQAARFCAAILAKREGKDVRAELADVEILDAVGWYAEHSDAEIKATRALCNYVARVLEGKE
jgi:hypothetical protein